MGRQILFIKIFIPWVILFFSSAGFALEFRLGQIIAPPNTFFVTEPGIIIDYNEKEKFYQIKLPPDLIFPFTIKAAGPLGGWVVREINSPSDLTPMVISSGVIKDPNPNPQNLNVLPLLCPRVILPANNGEIPVYDASQDRLNRIPIFQLLDPDAKTGIQYKSYSNMDGENTLSVSQITVSQDYEDNRILDYSGPHPLTGQPETIYEGEGGFYANIHYAVIPYSKTVLHLDRQTLLHLAQGKLSEINREDLRPALRTHSLLPGPFLSRTGYAYDLCEWGDTTYQAPVQRLNYKGLNIWDWDYPVKKSDHVLLILWEGDEEDWMIQKKLIDPFYLTDDLIGVFEIRRKDTLKPLTLVNSAGDFEITIQTGN